jgi:hypothetical protein
MPPGCNEADIPGNRPWDIEIEKLFDEVDGMIVMFLKESDHVIPADVPDLLRDLLKDYERMGQKTYKEGQEAVQKKAKRVKVYECEDCGCREVEGSAWIHLNTGKPRSDPADGQGPIEGIYCPKCECFVGVKEREV